MQAEWLPEQYRSGAAFRAATRYKGAPSKLQQQLAQGPGVGGMYLPRRIGVGSTTCIMQWEVRFQALMLGASHDSTSGFEHSTTPTCIVGMQLMPFTNRCQHGV